MMLLMANQYPLLDILFSITLCIGLYQVGNIFLKIKAINNVFFKVSDPNFLKCTIGINLISLIFFPLILFIQKKELIYFASYTLLILGLIKTIDLILNLVSQKKIIFFDKKKLFENLDTKLLYLVLLGYFLLSFSVLSHGDALGYHFEIAKNLLKKGYFAVEPLFLQSYLFGSGEMLIALGLVFGAESFVNLMQFSGLLSLFGILKKFTKNNFDIRSLLLFCSPVLIFLTSAHKPQLFYICSLSIVFSFFFLVELKQFKKKELLIISVVSYIFLLNAINAKFIFILSSVLIGLKIFYECYKKKILFINIIFLIILLIIFHSPIIFWKIDNLDFKLVEIFLSPLPSTMIGYEFFFEYLKNYKRDFVSYINIFFHLKIGEITRSLGIGVILYFFLFKKVFNSNKSVALIIFTFAVIVFCFGQFTARTLLEPFIWLGISSIVVIKKFKINNKINLIFRSYCIVMILCVYYGIFHLLPWSFSLKHKENIQFKNANGFALFKWMNSKLKEDDKVLSFHRSIYLGNSQMMGNDFLWVLGKDNIYNTKIIEEFYKFKPEYILSFDINSNKIYYSGIKKCFGDLIYQQDGVSFQATRNPMNRSNQKKRGYIFRFNYKNFPDCLKNNE